MYILSVVEKNVFTRYIDTYNNIYISDIVGKCNRLDKCGYHYTPHQYFTDNPLRRGGKIVCLFVYIGKTNKQTTNFHPRHYPPSFRHCSPVLYHRVRERENREHPLALQPEPLSTVIPREHSDRGNLLADYTLSTRIVSCRLRGDSSLHSE